MSQAPIPEALCAQHRRPLKALLLIYTCMIMEITSTWLSIPLTNSTEDKTPKRERNSQSLFRLSLSTPHDLEMGGKGRAKICPCRCFLLTPSRRYLPHSVYTLWRIVLLQLRLCLKHVSHITAHGHNCIQDLSALVPCEVRYAASALGVGFSFSLFFSTVRVTSENIFPSNSQFPSVYTGSLTPPLAWSKKGILHRNGGKLKLIKDIIE